MTLSEAKASIISNLNQQSVSVLVDQLANLAVQHEELKTKHAKLEADYAELEKRVTEIVKRQDGPLQV